MIDLMMMIVRRLKRVSRDIRIKLLTVKSYGDERSSEVVRRRAKGLCQIVAEEMQRVPDPLLWGRWQQIFVEECRSLNGRIRDRDGLFEGSWRRKGRLCLPYRRCHLILLFPFSYLVGYTVRGAFFKIEENHKADQCSSGSNGMQSTSCYVPRYNDLLIAGYQPTLHLIIMANK